MGIKIKRYRLTAIAIAIVSLVVVVVVVVVEGTDSFDILSMIKNMTRTTLI